MANQHSGTISLTIGAVTPRALVCIERLKVACDDYVVKSFSLHRGSASNDKYGKEVITIMRRYSDLYPEFLEDKFCNFVFYDEIVTGSKSLDKMGLTIKETPNGFVNTMAVAKFVQIIFQVFNFNDTAFISPLRRVVMDDGTEFMICELLAVDKHRIADRKVVPWLVEQKKKMLSRKDKAGVK